MTVNTMTVNTVVFDVGETLIDESRLWLRWAQYLGVPPLTFLGLMGAGMALTDRNGSEFALEITRPGLTFSKALVDWATAEPDSPRSSFDADDLYPDVRPALAELQQMGLRVIISGNQPLHATPMLEAMHLPVDLICNSAELGVEKPDPQFFAAVVELAGVPAAQIAYVGDRYDNDVQPVRLAGMLPILIRRGPWGFLHAQQFAAVDPDLLIIDSLTELPELLRLSHQKN